MALPALTPGCRALRRLFGANGYRLLRSGEPELAGGALTRLASQGRAFHSVICGAPPILNTTLRICVSGIRGSRHFSKKVPSGFGRFAGRGGSSDSKASGGEADSSTSSDPPKSEGKMGNSSGKPKGPGDSKNDGENPFVFLCAKPFRLLFYVLGALASYKVLSYNELPNEVTMQEFLSKYLMRGCVETILIVNGKSCRCILRSDSKTVPKVVSFRIRSVEAVERKLDDIQGLLGIHPENFVPVKHVEEVEWLQVLKYAVIVGIPVAYMAAIMWRFLHNSQYLDRVHRMRNLNLTDAKELKVGVRFKDVAGMHSAKLEISEFVDYLKNPKAYEQYGAKIPKGALLCGAPGTGKTLLAKAVAGEANVPFYFISGSDFVEIYVGVGPSRVRSLFKKARENAPSIVFIDEIDAVGKKRAGKGGFVSHDERDSTLNQILVEMDGFNASSGVLVLAGTNRHDILDPALVRPGRFDRIITINSPDLEERYEIFKVHLAPLKLNKLLDVDDLGRRLAALTPGFVGAQIANVANEAAIQAARRKSPDGVDLMDFEASIERIVAGLRRSNQLMSPEQKLVVAYHEVGHALVGWWLEHADPVLKVSIVPRSSGALGYSQQIADETPLFSREALLDKIAVILGGRASEEIFIGRITTGAADDLHKVTRMCYAFVSKWGMNPALGLVSYQRDGDDSAGFYREYSDSTALLIDNEVRSIIEGQYARVKELLKEKAELVHKLAKLLYDRETLSHKDIASCVGERAFPMHERLRPYVLGGISGAPVLPSLSGAEPEKPQGEVGRDLFSVACL
ncbi:ATP-dependent metalloprotease FtsH family protein, putative [Babesia bigemina]|uniref:ATP-dependent metalloprotease FtsH family protein, putative n=1 Tax=Babesia bigemina TaxID=5866 RepID=A0A061D908_BABBI|nr:ATP-dependent metalloprotease FtsH family protein, putative [Babesia bigemina]CDR97033.1 ATP-dependent metalloprotease FtsH family protein, putative [Babesia bigemina]|eukprot:XP_012769219.1 ATP-dependent metalloprotease FtsH family protein, putative [Babesia bigemina]